MARSISSRCGLAVACRSGSGGTGSCRGRRDRGRRDCRCCRGGLRRQCALTCSSGCMSTDMYVHIYIYEVRRRRRKSHVPSQLQHKTVQISGTLAFLTQCTERATATKNTAHFHPSPYDQTALRFHSAIQRSTKLLEHCAAGLCLMPAAHRSDKGRSVLSIQLLLGHLARLSELRQPPP